MELMKHSKVFALAAVFALVAGCGGDANTQEEVADEITEEVVAEEVHSSDEALAEGMSDAEDQVDAVTDTVLPAINTIYFDFDKSNIRSEFYDVLNGHAAYLMANPSATVKLEGHTDERGTPEYNLALGERRGNSVQRYLSLQGVDASQLEVVSYGEERPAVRGQSSEAYSKNRRVEFNY
ncbi:peptidoglycan-associated lipoprotein Pal [Marinospirillum insulare]|uniref:Peptidoglycan-associated lipoprotein n=1 Tax=Marinospirillum insulare TaxID=217169 RepID=A0ABQ5ZRS3_9GAMM|nr:peptidoglycan-associated lipoprotein Pal [Marinospirillum insulare]GLR62845.1 peptidoglycan-associated lipoprotein [Marinospirillum insulare]